MYIKKLLISAGAMKAGTSYLYKLLERHAAIEVTPVKEIHYFAHAHTSMKLLDDAARLHALKAYTYHLNVAGDVQDAQRGLRFFARYLRSPIDDAWYESLFQSGDDVYKADFSNMASVLPDEGLQHIRRMAEDIRVLFVMRDPLARLWSHVKFHAAVNDELARLRGFDCEQFARYFDATGAAAHSRYADNIARMRLFFPTHRLKLVYFEDMVTEPRDTFDSIFAFLSLTPVDFDEDEMRIVHNPGPTADMPAAFRKAAMSFLAPLQAELEEAGIALHPRWHHN